MALALGLLLVTERTYVKRCEECRHVSERTIPAVPRPAVLLLDQWTASSLVKALLPASRERFVDPDDPQRQRGFWPRAYSRLERLVKGALLVCPESTVHREESVLDDRLTSALHRVFVHLTGGSSLRSTGQVVRWQLYGAFLGYLDGTPAREVSRDDVVSLSALWPQRLVIDVQVELDIDVDALRRFRERLDDQLSATAQEWAEQSGRSFDELRDEQLNAFGPSYIPAQGELFALTWSAMDERGVPVERRKDTLEAFLRSDAAARIPAAQLRAGLLAAIGWTAARRQLGPVTASLRWDLQSISAYASYVDAIFVDRQCHRLLRHTQLAAATPPELKVFSTDNLEAFEDWLDDVEASAPDGHFDLLTRVYGAKWLQTYDRLLDPPAQPRDDESRTGPHEPPAPGTMC